MEQLQVIIKYKKIDFDFDSITSIEHKRTFQFNELQTAESEIDKGYFTFMQFIKRKLLDSLEDSFTHVQMEVSVGDIQTIHVYHSGNGNHTLSIDCDPLSVEGYRKKIQTRGFMIRKSIEKLCQRFDIKTF